MTDSGDARTVPLRIESLAYEGWGVGRAGGRVLFVPGTCPGDRVVVRVEKDQKSYGFACVVKLLEEGPGRRTPPCPVAGECGGCQWQHVGETAQREQKLAIFRDLLRRIGGIEPPAVRMVPPRGGDLGYRTRVRVVVHPQGPAFRKAGSREPVPVPGCPIAAAPLHDLLAAWAKEPPAWFAREEFVEAEITWVASPGAFQVNLLTRRGRKARELTVETEHEGAGLWYSVNNRWVGRRPPRGWLSPESFTYVIPGEVLGTQADLRMSVGPGDFLQPNAEENVSLVEAVLELGRPEPGGRALDLFCGVGNFTLPLALRGMEAVGVDSSAGAVRRAEFNAKRNGVAGCRFRASRVESVLGGIRREGRPFDLVVLDPPRTGCKNILGEVAGIRPRSILYVSCNPATLARDLKALAERGYRLVESRLVDLFPQTYHVESVNLLTPEEASA